METNHDNSHLFGEGYINIGFNKLSLIFFTESSYWQIKICSYVCQFATGKALYLWACRVIQFNCFCFLYSHKSVFLCGIADACFLKAIAYVSVFCDSSPFFYHLPTLQVQQKRLSVIGHLQCQSNGLFLSSLAALGHIN